MKMKLLELLRDQGLKPPTISRRLREDLSIDVSIQGVAQYENARSMRLDVLCGLRKLSGLSWSAIGKLLDDEFLPDEGKK